MSSCAAQKNAWESSRESSRGAPRGYRPGGAEVGISPGFFVTYHTPVTMFLSQLSRRI